MSSICLSRFSTRPAISLDVSRDVPGGKTTFNWTAPSLKGGRKSRSNWMRKSAATTTKNAGTARLSFGNRKLNRMILSPNHLTVRKTNPSFSRSISFPPPSSQYDKTGVTVSDTSVEESRETIYATPSGANNRPSMPDSASKGTKREDDDHSSKHDRVSHLDTRLKHDEQRVLWVGFACGFA